MAKPVIMTVDDDPAVLAAVTRDLQARFAEEFQIVGDAVRARRRLQRLASVRAARSARGDDRLRSAHAGHDRHRAARASQARGARGEARAAHRVRGHRCRDSCDQRHPPRPLPDEAVGSARGEALPHRRRPARRLATRPAAAIVRRSRSSGHRWSERSHELKTFLARNYVPYAWFDLERDDEAQRLHDLAHAVPSDLPLVLIADGEALRVADAARCRRCARAAHQCREAAVRPLHRGRRSRGAGRRRLCRVGGPRRRADRRSRARRSGRSERSHRELPRVPEGALGCGPRGTGDGPGPAVRGRGGARP